MEAEFIPLVATKPEDKRKMRLAEIFGFLRACHFNPHTDVCHISQTKGYITISNKR